MIKYEIYNHGDYPQTCEHQICETILPFKIEKGCDSFVNVPIHGKVITYGIDKKGNYKTDKRWLCELSDGANPSLEKIFVVQCHTNLEKILKYCTRIYLKSLRMEIERVKASCK